MLTPPGGGGGGGGGGGLLSPIHGSGISRMSQQHCCCLRQQDRHPATKHNSTVVPTLQASCRLNRLSLLRGPHGNVVEWQPSGCSMCKPSQKPVISAPAEASGYDSIAVTDDPIICMHQARLGMHDVASSTMWSVQVEAVSNLSIPIQI